MNCLVLKGTLSSRSEPTCSRALNRCPSLRWTQWLKITGSFMHQQQYDLIMWGIMFSHWVSLKLALRFHALLIVTILPLWSFTHKTLSVTYYSYFAWRKKSRKRENISKRERFINKIVVPWQTRTKYNESSLSPKETLREMSALVETYFAERGH